MALGDHMLGHLLRDLDEAGRSRGADVVSRFVAPRPGLVEQVRARRHYFILGRRGTGKTTLLRRIEAEGAASGAVVVYIDLETLRGRTYPDVLIMLLAASLTTLETDLTVKGFKQIQFRTRSRSARRSLRRLTRTLSDMLQEPQSVERTLTRMEASRRYRRATARFSLEASSGAAILSGGRSRIRERADQTEARYTDTKMHGLIVLVPALRRVLTSCLDLLGSSDGIVVLDEFNHVAVADQPVVLAYLHQLLKGLDIYLKVGAVASGFNSYDPEFGQGMLHRHDAVDISLDLDLGDVNTREFLRAVAISIIAPHGVTLEDLIAEGVEDHLVHASGGIIREYLYLLTEALRIAGARGLGEKVLSQDIDDVVRGNYERRIAGLSRSIPTEERLRVQECLAAIRHFCITQHRTNIFLVDESALIASELADSLMVLRDHQFIHAVGSVLLSSGRICKVFALDLGLCLDRDAQHIVTVSFWNSKGRGLFGQHRLVFEPPAGLDPSETSTNDRGDGFLPGVPS